MVDTKAWKDIVLTFAGKLVTAGWSAVKACALVGLHRTTWYRHLNPPAPAGITVPQTERAYPNRITTAEAEEFMGLLNSEDYGNLSVTQAYYRMLDAGHCSFSIAAAHRIVARHGQNGDRRPQRSGTGPKRAKPVLEATAPNQLWSWDITMLHGPGKHTYRLYTMLDVFSRKVVGHRVEYTETAALASALIRDAVAGNRQRPAVLHADNGAPMRAGTTLDLARALGITLSYSRPRVSDDNPYSESLFKTVKYDLDFPQRFQDLQHRPRTHGGVLRGLQRQPPPQRPELLHTRHRPPRTRRAHPQATASNTRRLLRPQPAPIPTQTLSTGSPSHSRDQQQTNHPAVTNSLIYTGEAPILELCDQVIAQLLDCQHRQTGGDHQVPFVEHTAVLFPRADEGGTSEVSGGQQLFQCRQCPGLAWTLLAVHLLKKARFVRSRTICGRISSIRSANDGRTPGPGSSKFSRLKVDTRNSAMSIIAAFRDE
ncbi:hypothetical protein ASG92_25425 [Arthrobacter sp. Soil736]|uniref:IS3 family transposase n=1 Tax=Arthrobacter sp. Soil736 TaxID=1736395 RepID=UPI0006FE2E8A|nr:IS3 family transposase [Arthrobacter sp. Soil736]KRE52394.1 hypothetical protein ASG92_25425 [Arthrobacter sp. Soil736]